MPTQVKGNIDLSRLRRLSRRAKRAMLLGLLGILVVSGAAVATWYLTRTKPLSDFELSAAEHLAGRWDLAADAAEAHPNNFRSTVFQRILGKCNDYGARIVFHKPDSQLSQEERIGPMFKRLHEKVQDCLDRSYSDDRPFAANPNIDEVTLDELRSWWPYHLLGLREQDEGLEPIYFAASPHWGLAGDPKSENVGAIISYYKKDAPPTTLSLQDVLDVGGLWVTSEWLPKIGEHPSKRDKLGEAIQVQGTSGHLLEVLTEDARDRNYVLTGQVNRMFVYWDIVEDPGRLRIEVVASPKRYARNETLRLIQKLTNLSESGTE